MGRRIKILYMIGTLDLGGTEGQLVQLATRLDSRRFEPVVCCLSSGGVYQNVLVAAGIRVEVIGFRGLVIFRHPLRVAAELLRLVRFMRQERPSIVHGMLFWAYLIGTYAARLARVPIVIASRRGLGHFKANKSHYLFLEMIANRMTNLVVANSEAVKQDAMRMEFLPSEKIRVIHNGIEADLYRVATDPVLREDLCIPADRAVVAVLANLIHYKGHRYLLEACHLLAEQGMSVTLLLIGEGPCRLELEAQAKSLGLVDTVRFLGSRRDVPSLLALANLLVHPSLEEGFPNAVLEAMAAGKPIVATNVGGVPEAVIHGETGLLVPPGDPLALASAIIEILRDPVRASAMGHAGRVRVTREFGIDRMVLAMERLYDGLVHPVAVRAES